MYRIKRFNEGTDKKNEGSGGKKLIIGGGSGLVGSLLGEVVAGKLLRRSPVDDEGVKMTKDLIKDARSNGIVAKNSITDLGYSADFRDESIRNHVINKLKSQGVSLEELKKSKPSLYEAIANKKPLVVSSSNNPAIIAHELGHVDFGGTKIGKKFQGKFLYDTLSRGLPQLGVHGASFASGINSAIRKSKGEDEGLISKNAAWLGPVLTSTPMLVSEFEASRRGINRLKKLGASKALIAKSKKDLALAGASYLAETGSRVGLNYLIRGVGKIAGKEIAKNREG